MILKTSQTEDVQKDHPASNKKIPLKKQFLWMFILWCSGVIALYLFVKIAKGIMSAVGLGT